MRADWLGMIPLAEGVLWLISKGDCRIDDVGRGLSLPGREPPEGEKVAADNGVGVASEGALPLLGGCIMSLEEAPVRNGREYLHLDHLPAQSRVRNGSQSLGAGSDGGGGTRDRSIGGGGA